MSPQIEATKLPPGFTLAKRPTCQPTDERPVLRDENGRCLAIVEQWRPDLSVN